MVTRRRSAVAQRLAYGRAWRRHQAGATIVELCISIVIAIIIGAAILTVFVILVRSLSLVMAKATVTSQLRSAVEQIGRDVQIAKARRTTPCGSPPVYTPSDVVLILEVPAGAVGAGIERVIYQCAAASIDCPGNCIGSPGCLERILEDANCANPPVRHTIARNATLWYGAVVGVAWLTWTNDPLDTLRTTYGPPNPQTVVTRLQVQATVGGITTSGKLVVLNKMRNL